jgi:hypothetical protein
MTTMHVMTSDTELMVQNPETGSMPMHFEWGQVDSVQFSHEQNNKMYHGILMDQATMGALDNLMGYCIAKVKMKPATETLIVALKKQVLELLVALQGDDIVEKSA